MKNKITIVTLFILFFGCSHINAQDYYKKYRSPEKSEGKRLEISGSDFIAFDKVDSINQAFRLNLNADYRQWRFTPLTLLGGYLNANANINTLKNNSDTSLTDQHYLINLYGGASRYLKPNQFYGTVAFGTSYGKEKRDTSSTGSIDPKYRMPAYLWGALGYGRINNAERVAVGIDFIKRLQARNLIQGTVSDATLMALVVLLDKRDNGDFEAKSKDDNEIDFFDAVEKLLQQSGNISGTLDAAATLRLFQVLTNDKYVYYERYTGYQIQAEAQYQIDNGDRTKPHDHYLSISGVYGLPLSNATQFVGSAFFAMPLDSLASGSGPRNGFGGPFQNFLPFINDRNNLDFFDQTTNPANFSGTGLFSGRYVAGRHKSFGLRANLTHSLSSFAGVSAFAQFLSTSPKTGDAISDIDGGARLDYNILNQLRAFLIATLHKTSSSNKAVDRQLTYRVALGFSYRVF